MYLTVEDVKDALRRLRKLRRSIVEKRATVTDPHQIEHFHRLMETVQVCEKERLEVLERVRRGEKIR
jgi:hypothetical protein